LKNIHNIDDRDENKYKKDNYNKKKPMRAYQPRCDKIDGRGRQLIRREWIDNKRLDENVAAFARARLEAKRHHTVP